MNTRHGATSIFAICLSAIFALPAFAQSQTTGRIAGTVKDEKGAVIRDAEVTITTKPPARREPPWPMTRAITSFRSFRPVFTRSASRRTASRKR